MKRTAMVATLAAAVLVGGCSASTESAESSPARDSAAPTAPLDILLTNDDGWDADGIRAVYAALRADGHNVTVSAPAVNQSGVGGLKTFWGPVGVNRPDLVTHPEYAGAEVWAVGPSEANPRGGTPSDSVHFGLSHLFKDKAPDLVVSGANHGINTGGAANNSGTVNAAIEALEQGVPAIAISTEDPAECDPETTAPALDFTETASYTSELVGEIASRRDGEGPLLPAGVGLNVTYPAGKAKGTKLTVADVDPAQVDFVETTPGQFEAVPSCAGTADDPATDFGAMRAGYVAITQLGAPQKQGGVADDLDYLAELK